MKRTGAARGSRPASEVPPAGMADLNYARAAAAAQDQARLGNLGTLLLATHIYIDIDIDTDIDARYIVPL